MTKGPNPWKHPQFSPRLAWEQRSPLCTCPCPCLPLWSATSSPAGPCGPCLASTWWSSPWKRPDQRSRSHLREGQYKRYKQNTRSRSLRYASLWDTFMARIERPCMVPRLMERHLRVRSGTSTSTACGSLRCTKASSGNEWAHNDGAVVKFMQEDVNIHRKCQVWKNGLPLTFSRVILSTWMTHFLRYTCTTFPSRPLNVPLVTRTSSSFLMGTDRTCADIQWVFTGLVKNLSISRPKSSLCNINSKDWTEWLLGQLTMQTLVLHILSLPSTNCWSALRCTWCAARSTRDCSSKYDGLKTERKNVFVCSSDEKSWRL